MWWTLGGFGLSGVSGGGGGGGGVAQIVAIEGAVDISTTLTTYTSMFATPLSITTTTVNRVVVFIDVAAEQGAAVAYYTNLRLVRDSGAEIVAVGRAYTTANSNIGAMWAGYAIFQSLAFGTHTFDLQWAVSAAGYASYCRPVSAPNELYRMMAWEV